MTAPTTGQAERINLAAIAHTARVAGLPQAPLGVLAGTEQVGGVTVRRDYNLDELLEGLRGVGVDLTGHQWPTVDDVITTGYGVDPVTFPADQRLALDRALAAAIDIVTLRVERSWGIA